MAGKVEGELGLKISGFQGALNKASHLMKEFGEHAKETAAQAGEQLRDVLKDTGSNKLANMLGLAGAGVAVTAFGAAVVETVKEGSQAFEKFETSALQLGILVGDSKVGTEIAEWIDTIDGAGGSTEDLTNAMKQFIEAGLGVEEAKTKLLEYQKLAIGTGDSIESLAQSFRKVKAGGLDAGEGAARLLKSGPMMMLATEEKNRGLNEKKAKAQQEIVMLSGTAGGEKAKEDLAAVDAQMKETTSDWVKKGNLTSKVLDQILARVTGPGGKFEHAVEQVKETQAGKKADVADEWEHLNKALGEAMSTGLKPALDDLITELPKLKGYFVALGTAAGSAIHVLETLGGMVKAGVEATSKGGEGATAEAYEILHGKGSYKMLTEHPNLTSQQNRGEKIVQVDKLETHALAQLSTLVLIREELKHLVMGGL